MAYYTRWIYQTVLGNPYLWTLSRDYQYREGLMRYLWLWTDSPFNFLLAYSTPEYRLLVLFWILGLIAIFYIYRGARAGQIGLKFLGTDQFHFLLYLCTVEIAPVLFLVKLAMIQTD